jgi:hypothetical protein
MDTRVEQACILLGTIGIIFAVDGVPRFVGWQRRSFLYLYRDPSADRWSRLIPVASVYLGCGLLALVGLFIAMALWQVGALVDLLAVVVVLSAAAAALVLAKGPWWLLPPWAALLVRRNWRGYWGDEADKVRVPENRWASLGIWGLGGAAIVTWIVVSPGLEKVWPVGFGIAATLKTMRSKGNEKPGDT